MGEPPEKKDTLYAVFETSKGDITCMLYAKRAPITVANFVGLAEGSKTWIHPATGKMENKPLYSGTIFHRVIPNFMIQGGDPLGSGFGGPGYRFQDEFDDFLTFAGPGRLAMANSGPGTNGSQFFITVAPTPWLNGRHTVFGQVMSGMEVVEAITSVEKDANDKPIEPVVLKRVLIKDSL
jgi:peptidyl-prolyl cis-trans isomerase A (cyclophilin A)